MVLDLPADHPEKFLTHPSFAVPKYNMGQDQSKGVESPVLDQQREDPPSSSAHDSSPSMDSLLAEATAFGNVDENASLEDKAQKALECPCLKNLRSGPCGSQFSDAFLCFMKSTVDEKGSDCVQPFVALQNCIKTNPDAFPKDVLEDIEVDKKEKPTRDYKIIPPKWSVESASRKRKL